MIFKNYFLIVTFAGGGGLSRVNRYDAIKVSHDTLRHKLHKVEFNVHLLCQQKKNLGEGRLKSTVKEYELHRTGMGTNY